MKTIKLKRESNIENQWKGCFLTVIQIDKYPARKTKKIQIRNIKNTQEDVVTDHTDIKNKIKRYYE